VGSTAHKLKSSAKSVGALRLGTVCDSLEEAGRSGDLRYIENSLPEFRAALDAVLADAALQDDGRIAERTVA
jgi:two-component system sensor histidine kinase/response regulator